MTDLAAIAPLVRGASVVALADGTHGTHEFFAMKQQLIRAIAPDAIAFEAPYAEWQGSDPAAFLPSTDYWFWDAQEILDTITSARAAGIDVVGVDCIHPHPAIRMVLDFLDGADRAEAERAYSCLNQYAANPWSYLLLSPTGQEECRAKIALVRPIVEAHRVATDEFERVLHAARVVEQGELALTTRNYDNRDACMAENIEWLASRRGKVVVLGHNEHFGRTPYGNNVKSAGAYLDQRLGTRYVSIGSVAMRGSFWAYDASHVITDQTLSAPGADDTATFFSAAARPQMFVSLAAPLPPYLTTPHPIRLGGSNGPATVVEDLARKFDGIIYVETSTPSQLRHFPRLP